MLAEPWGYARQNIAPLVLVKVWAARLVASKQSGDGQHRPTLVVVSSCAALELPHDDFRRAHFDYRDAHYDWRRSDYDFRMTLVTLVPVPSAFGNKTSGGSEEGDNAGK
jgi:hypothetical protein